MSIDNRKLNPTGQNCGQDGNFEQIEVCHAQGKERLNCGLQNHSAKMYRRIDDLKFTTTIQIKDQINE